MLGPLVSCLYILKCMPSDNTRENLRKRAFSTSEDLPRINQASKACALQKSL